MPMFEGLHSSLIDYESIMIVRTEYSPGRKFVFTMDLDHYASNETESIYNILFKRNLLEPHIRIQIKLLANAR